MIQPENELICRIDGALEWLQAPQPRGALLTQHGTPVAESFHLSDGQRRLSAQVALEQRYSIFILHLHWIDAEVDTPATFLSMRAVRPWPTFTAAECGHVLDLVKARAPILSSWNGSNTFSVRLDVAPCASVLAALERYRTKHCRECKSPDMPVFCKCPERRRGHDLARLALDPTRPSTRRVTPSRKRANARGI